MRPLLRRFAIELAGSLATLAAYFGALAIIGYGGLVFLRGDIIRELGVIDQALEWLEPVTMQADYKIHPSLRPRLRGAVDQ